MRHLLTAGPFIPAERSLCALQGAAAECQGCELHKNGTRTVFGEGPITAAIMLVGEIPGDREERAGRPMIGPAGQLLDQVLHEIGLGRDQLYLTNAVKHFRFGQQGQRRLHKRPTWRDIRACRPWLEAEIELIRPKVLVCMGATAAQSLMGSHFRIMAMRGRRLHSPWADYTVATYHPSAILRAPEKSTRMAMRDEFVDDLRRAFLHIFVENESIAARRRANGDSPASQSNFDSERNCPVS